MGSALRVKRIRALAGSVDHREPVLAPIGPGVDRPRPSIPAFGVFDVPLWPAEVVQPLNDGGPLGLGDAVLLGHADQKDAGVAWPPGTGHGELDAWEAHLEGGPDGLVTDAAVSNRRVV